MKKETASTAKAGRKNHVRPSTILQERGIALLKSWHTWGAGVLKEGYSWFPSLSFSGREVCDGWGKMLEIFQVLAWRLMSLLWESNLRGIPHCLTIFFLREAAGGCSALKWEMGDAGLGHPSSWTLTRRLEMTVLGDLICSLWFAFHSALQILSLSLIINYLFGKERITSFSHENNQRKHTSMYLCLVSLNHLCSCCCC